MKKNIFVKGLAVIAAIGMLPACSSDYLSLAPESNPSQHDVSLNTQNAQLAINGICRAMNTQYQATSYNQYNGESYINTLLNDAVGQDYISGLGLAGWGNDFAKHANWNNSRLAVLTLPWQYCYNIIRQANVVLEGIDDAEERGAYDRAFVKAEALTFRAFAYTKLMMYYAPRWEDSNNGSTYCCVLRTKSDIANVPAATMAQCLDLIYSDLDEAIRLFGESKSEREFKWQPDLSVAYGVYARAALIKNDWAKAQTMAHNARQGYSVMDNATYLAGFYEDNNDFMWHQGDEASDIYYWSYGSHYSVNGTYVNNWDLGAGAIDINLYRQLDPNDIRRQCFLTPDKVGFITNINSGWNPGKVTEEDWWNADLVDESHDLTLNAGPSNRASAINGKWGLYNLAVRFCKYYGESIFTGNYEDMANEGAVQSGAYMAYYVRDTKGDMLIGGGMWATLKTCPFGAQFKFWSKPPYGVSKYPFMRASEMVLAEAEAAYHNGDITTAQNCLNEINGKRIPGYTCTSTGEALFEEIKLCRRIELWGEGQNWTDFKRWNIPIDRKPWVVGDATSGNWPNAASVTIPVDQKFGWKFPFPTAEFEYNNLVDRNLIED